MRKLLILIEILLLASCKPEVYLGPLDTPVGNWKSQASTYYFDGENVYENEQCTYSAISFYKDSLCCIEGVKGAFTWTLSNDSLVVDTLVWKVVEMTGANLKLDYLGIIEKPAAEPDEEVAVTFAYQGQTIETDGWTYWYVNDEDKQVRCWPVSEVGEDGEPIIVCWWDSRSDTYKQF